MTTDLHSPRAASQWDSVPVPELARLRRIAEAAQEAVTALLDVPLAPKPRKAVQALHAALEAPQ